MDGGVCDCKHMGKRTHELPRGQMRLPNQKAVVESRQRGKMAAIKPPTEPEDGMKEPGSSSAANPSASRNSRRNVWVVTAYAITGLAVFGVLAYYLSDYLAR